VPVLVSVVIPGLLVLVPPSVVVVYEPCMLVYFAFSVFEPLGFVYFALVRLVLGFPPFIRSVSVVGVVVVLHDVIRLVVVRFGGGRVGLVVGGLGVIGVRLVPVGVVVAAVTGVSRAVVTVGHAGRVGDVVGGWCSWLGVASGMGGERMQ
jgi:hypothetical protein